MVRGTIYETPRMTLQEGEAVVTSNHGGRSVVIPTRATQPLSGPG